MSIPAKRPKGTLPEVPAVQADPAGTANGHSTADSRDGGTIGAHPSKESGRDAAGRVQPAKESRQVQGSQPSETNGHAGANAASSVPSILEGTEHHELDVERESDVPISTQLYWQIAYQIDSRRLTPGSRLAPVRDLGAALRVNPNTIRAVYRRLAEAGYVTTRQGAGTHVVERPPLRRGPEDLAGLVAEMLRRAAQAGFTPDEVAAATFAAATERKRPGPRVRVLFGECTRLDAAYGAARIGEAFPDDVEAEGAQLEELPERLERFHYDIVATTPFHGDEVQECVPEGTNVVVMMIASDYLETIREITALPRGAKVGLVCASPRGAANMGETLRLSVGHGVELIDAIEGSARDLGRVDQQADLILLSRDALALGLDEQFSRPERLREWTYEFDPSGLELLRRAIERVHAARSD